MNFDWPTAFRWDATNGMVPLSDPPVFSKGQAVSANGEVVVGDLRLGTEAYRWDAANGMIGLGFLPGHSRSTALGVSADGSVVVGFSGDRHMKLSAGMPQTAW